MPRGGGEAAADGDDGGGEGKERNCCASYQRTPPPMPKIENDGNPRFVIFIRMANVYLWYPLNIIAGGTTAKIMVAAKDNLLGKYIYKDTIARNIAAVIYRLPTQDQLKTVLDKVKDFFGDAKESFGKISSLNPGTDEETEKSPDEKAK